MVSGFHRVFSLSLARLMVNLIAQKARPRDHVTRAAQALRFPTATESQVFTRNAALFEWLSLSGSVEVASTFSYPIELKGGERWRRRNFSSTLAENRERIHHFFSWRKFLCVFVRARSGANHWPHQTSGARETSWFINWFDLIDIKWILLKILCDSYYRSCWWEDENTSSSGSLN